VLVTCLEVVLTARILAFRQGTHNLVMDLLYHQGTVRLEALRTAHLHYSLESTRPLQLLRSIIHRDFH